MKIAILTSGGDAPGMNAAVRGVVRYALSQGHEVIGYMRGYQGILEGDSEPLVATSVSNMIGQGGTFLQSDRCPEFLEKECRLRAFEQLKADKVDALIAIGGDGTFRGARDLYVDTGFPVIGIPATIDNDMGYTDFTIGFDTAVNNVLNAINCLRDTMHSHNKITVVEVMGRKCGNIALASGISGGAEFILVPEIPFNINQIVDEVKNSQRKGKRSNLIVLAEGAGKMEDFCVAFEMLSGIKPRQTRLGFIQRGGSPTYRDRLLACRLAKQAVDCVLEGRGNRAVGIHGTEYFDMDIEEAVNIKRKIDTDLYNFAELLN